MNPNNAESIALAIAESVYDATGFKPAVVRSRDGSRFASVTDGDKRIDIVVGAESVSFNATHSDGGRYGKIADLTDDRISEIAAAFFGPDPIESFESADPESSEIRGFDVRIEWTNGDEVRAFRDRSRTGSPSELLATIADEIATDRRDPKNITIEFLYG